MKPVEELPFECFGNLILIKAKVNDDQQSRFFIFDTCASASLFDMETANQMGLEPDRTELVVDAAGGQELASCAGQRLKFGNTEINTALILVDLSRLSASIGHRVDGVVGCDIMREFTIFVDHNRSILCFFSSAADFKATGFTKFEAKLEYGKMFLCPGEFQLTNESSFSGYWMLDTGCGATGIVQCPFVEQNRILQQAGDTATIAAHGVSSVIKFDIIKVRSLSLCDFRFDKLELNLAGESRGALAMGEHMGVLGNPVLQRFDMILDLHRRLVWLKPNHLFNDEFGFSMGLGLAIEKGSVVVVSVDSSAAFAKDLQVGDKIVSIDDQPTENENLESVRKQLQQEGATYTFKTDSPEGKQNVFELTVARLLPIR